MPYTDNKSNKFNDLVLQALIDIRKEPNFEDDLKDAELTEAVLKTEIKKYLDEIWRSVEVSITKYDLLEESLQKREAELAQESASSKSGTVGSPAEEQPTEHTALDRRERNLALDSIREDLIKLKEEIDSSILLGIKERMRLTINSKIQPNYDVHLKIFQAPGLAEVLDSERTIDTTAKTSLLYMLENMEGGSIGIAGSRGAGKSTLIQMCCGAKRKINHIKYKKVLPILTSAPVQYESRDFIMYLFSAVCQRVLDPDDIKDNLPEPPTTEGFSQPSLKNPAVRKFLTVAPRALYYFGGMLVVVSLVAAITFALLTRSQANTQAAQSAAPQSNQAVTPTASPTVTTTPNVTTQPPSFLGSTLQVLEFKPGILLSWGVFLFFSGLSIAWLRRGFTEILYFPQSYREFAAASDEQQKDWLSLVDKVQLPPVNKLAIQKRLMEFKQKLDQENSLSVLQQKAQYWLKEMKFQQSFTSGWSGALKLPVGFEGGINRAVTLAQKQLSNPEIVAAFMKFLREVSKEYKVIIGIDELDKIESDDDAQKFLNEIKSIFGLPECFYLISVSENAMSNFERRGLPFRDVFDSSFDNVVYVDYLNYRTAKSLLERRIIGKPLPFIYLSYCLSGGLPRDLIRHFRNLLELNQPADGGSSDGKDLTTLCSALLNYDVKAKVRATAASAKRIDLEPEGSNFIEMLIRIESEPLDEPNILSAVNELFHWKAERMLGPDASDEEKAEAVKCKKMKQLSSELGSYLYFLATILWFFNNSLDEAKLKAAVRDGDLDRLAKARQLMAINPSAAILTLNAFRGKRELSTLVAEGHPTVTPRHTPSFKV